MRLLRGLIRTALRWGAVWSLLLSPLIVYLWIDARRNAFVRPGFSLLAYSILLSAAWGALSGIVYGLLTSAFGRRGGWERLGAPKTAAWGFAGDVHRRSRTREDRYVDQ
jgi:hypothetical protein